MKNKINKQLVLIIILLSLSLIIGIMVHYKQILTIDKIAYSIIVEKLRTPFLTNIMTAITTLADANTVLIISIICAIIILPKDRRLSLIIPLNLIVITFINQLTKLIIKRPRPVGYRLIDIGGYSFPSGHAMVSLALYGLILFIANKIIKNKIIKIILNIVIITIIILIGISRIYLGVHYLSDILVGYFTSTVHLLLITKLIDTYIFNNK